MNSRKSAALLWITLLLGFATVWKLQHAIDVQRLAIHIEEDDLLLRSGALLKAVSLEYAPLTADLYWTRAVQYYGNKRANEDTRIDLLWPLLDVTTTLDPNLIIAYRFGSTFLSEPAPRGAGRPDLGIQLLQRGIAANPEYWRFYEDLGFIYYFELHDYANAANAFLEGSKKPGALIWMKTFAARIAERGETRETSVMLWSEIYNSTSDPDIKKNALTHLQLLRAQADCEELDKIVVEFERRTSHRLTHLRELITAGLLPGMAVDPLGYPYVLGADGKAHINPASPLSKNESIPSFRRS